MSSAPWSAAPSLRRAPSVNRLLSPSVGLVVIVVLAAIVRFALASGRTTPRYLPDEYLYPEFARSLARGDGMTILGVHSGFPALLEPLLLTPIWGSLAPAQAILATQALHSVLMALAAVPVFAIARRIGLAEVGALACAAAATFAPGLFFASLLSADALGYLLGLTTIALAVRALNEPTWRTQSVFLLGAGLATFARLQYVVLVPAFLAAAVLVERGLRPALRRQVVVAATTALAAVAGLVASSGALGRYQAVTSFGISTDAGRWALIGAFLLALGAGVAIVPGALAWLGATLVRPQDRAGLAFAAYATALTLALLAASSLFASETASDRFMERYLIVVAPLLVLAFARWLADGGPGRPVVVVTSLVLIVAAARVPVSGWTAGQGVADSPTLLAISRLERIVGVGNTSLVVAGLITLAAVLALAGGYLGRRAGLAVATFGAVAIVSLSVGAHHGDAATSANVRNGLWSGSPSWIDEAGARDPLLVQTPWSSRVDAMLTALMNPSIRRAVPFGTRGIDTFDGLGKAPLTVASDGRLLEAGRPVRQPVVWAIGGGIAAFDDARSVAYDRRFALVVPRDNVHLTLVADGFRYDGKVSQRGTIAVYPAVDGRCTRMTARLSVPAGVPRTLLEVRDDRGATRHVEVVAGSKATLEVTSTRDARRTLTYRTLRLGDRPVTPFDETVASADFRATQIACPAQGQPG